MRWRPRPLPSEEELRAAYWATVRQSADRFVGDEPIAVVLAHADAWRRARRELDPTGRLRTRRRDRTDALQIGLLTELAVDRGVDVSAVLLAYEAADEGTLGS